MKSIYISDQLHRQAKLKATEMGVPLKQLVEDMVQRGLEHTPPSASPGQLREPVAAYQGVVTADVQDSDADQWLARLAGAGVLLRAEQMRDRLDTAYCAARCVLALTALPNAEPPDVEEVRAVFRRQRELHPNAPAVSELLRQMREEE
jgi:hypothetical protein